MARIDTIRKRLGLNDMPGYYFDEEGGLELVGAEKPAEITLEQLEAPGRERLLTFRADEIESKSGKPTRPLPVDGEPYSWRMSVPYAPIRLLLPIFIRGPLEEGTYIEIDIAEQAEVTILLTTVQTEEPIYISLKQGAGSRVDFNIVKMPGFPSWQLVAWQADLERDALLRQHAFNLDSSAYQVGQVRLNGTGAECETMSADYVSALEEMRIDVSVTHFAEHTRSRIWNHGVVEGSAYGVYAGRGIIKPGAHGADCRQESRFLSLDPQARADSYPVLIIDDHDVQAGHATSVSQLDRMTLYYLQSRGLDRHQAQLLVTAGYLQPVLDRIASGRPELKTAAEWLAGQLHEKVRQ